MKEIILTQGYKTLVDDEDFDFLSQWKWCVQITPNKKYARRTKAPHLMHRVLLNPESGVEVDHANGDSLDNRRENLRICSHVENQRNRHVIRSNSGYKGVYFMKEIGIYRAHINLNNKYTYLGRFKTAEEAAQAYNEAAIKYFGKFASLNIILK